MINDKQNMIDDKMGDPISKIQVIGNSTGKMTSLFNK